MTRASRSNVSPWRRFVVYLGGLAVLALVVAAIGGCSAVGGRSTDSLTVALGEEPGTLDAQTETSVIIQFALEYNVTEELIKRMPDGTLKPLLAESWQDVDANTIRFNLRQNAKFSDGTPFDANAAKASLDRMRRPESRAGTIQISSVTEVKVSGPYTLDVLHKPDVALVQAFSWGVPMYSPKQMRENPESINTGPIGTGPYKIVKWEKGVALTLQARDDYWGKDLFGTPSIKNVKIVFRPEAAVRVALLESGEADLVADLLPDEAKRFDASKVVKAEGSEVFNVRIGMKDPVTSDLRVRQAISLAIDRKKLVDLFAGMAFAPAGGQIWPSWATGWASRPTPYDLEKAKALIREAGAAGKELDFTVTTGRYLLSGEVGDAVAGMLEQTGLKVKVQKMPHQQFLTRAREVQNPPALLFIANGHELGEVTQNLRNKFMCGGVLSTYCSKDFDEVATTALGEPNREKRVALIQKATDILDKDVPIVPLVTPANIYGKNPKLDMKPLPNALLPFIDMKLNP